MNNKDELRKIFKDAFERMDAGTFDKMHEIMVQDDMVGADIGMCAFEAMLLENEARESR